MSSKKVFVRLYYKDDDRTRVKDGALLSDQNGKYVILNKITREIEEYPFSSVLRAVHLNNEGEEQP